MLPTAALNTFNQPSCETPVGARLLCLCTSRWRHHCDPSLNTDGANCHFALRRCTHITESQPSCLLNIPPNSISDICLRCLTPLSFPQFCYQPTKWILKKKKKKACCSLSADASTLTTVCRKPQRFSLQLSPCDRAQLLLSNMKSTFVRFQSLSPPQKKKQTQVFLLICSVWQIGEFICTLKWHRVCSTEPDSHPPMTSAFFFFFFKNILLCSLQRPHNKHLLVSQLLVIRSAAVRERCFGSQVGSEADSVNKPLVM